MKPEQHYTKFDRLVAHREKMRNKAARRDRWHQQRNTPDGRADAMKQRPF